MAKIDFKLIIIAGLFLGAIFYFAQTRTFDEVKQVQLSIIKTMSTIQSTVLFEDYYLWDDFEDGQPNNPQFTIGEPCGFFSGGAPKGSMVIMDTETYTARLCSARDKDYGVDATKAFMQTNAEIFDAAIGDGFLNPDIFAAGGNGAEGIIDMPGDEGKYEFSQTFDSSGKAPPFTVAGCVIKPLGITPSPTRDRPDRANVEVVEVFANPLNPAEKVIKHNGRVICEGIYGSPALSPFSTNPMPTVYSAFWRPVFSCNPGPGEVLGFIKFNTGDHIDQSDLLYDRPRFCRQFAPIVTRQDNSFEEAPQIIEFITSGKGYTVPEDFKSVDVLYFFNGANVGISCAPGQKYDIRNSKCVFGLVEASDIDRDNVPSLEDNAPFVPNPEQTDTDNDGIGDVIDPRPNTPTAEVTAAASVGGSNVTSGSTSTPASSSAITTVIQSTPVQYRNFVKPTTNMTDAQIVNQQIQAAELNTISSKIVKNLTYLVFGVWIIVAIIFWLFNNASLGLFARRNIEGFILGGLTGLAFGVYIGLGFAILPTLTFAGIGVIGDHLWKPKE